SDAVVARVRHLALGPLAQIFHLRQRTQEFVLVVGSFAGERNHGVLFRSGRRFASRGIERHLGRGLIGSLIVLIGRGARCANGRIRHCCVPHLQLGSPPISGFKPQKSTRNLRLLCHHHPPISLLTTLAV